MMKLLQQEQDIRKQIFDYFGYQEDWRVLPFDDATEYYWTLLGTDAVRFSETIEGLSDDSKCYENEIYTQRHLNQWIYEGLEYTMMVVDTHTDGNKFLQIFSNVKKVVVE